MHPEKTHSGLADIPFCVVNANPSGPALPPEN